MVMNKKIILGVVVIAILVVAIILVMSNGSTSVSPNAIESQQQNPPQAVAPINPQSITPSSTAPTSSVPVAGPPAPMQQVALIVIQNFKFDSSSLTVKKGTTVVWDNNDSMAHTVTSDEGSELASPSIAPGGNYDHVFNSIGTFTYHCTIHPSMKGTIIVTN